MVSKSNNLETYFIMLFQDTTCVQAVHTAFKALAHQALWFHPADFHVAVAYTVGLIVHPDKRALFSVISHTTGVHVSALSDFLNPAVLGWPSDVLFNTLIQSLPEGGELITDLFVIPKDHTHCMEARKMWSSGHKRFVDGQAYALLLWTKAQQAVVIGCRLLGEHDKRFDVTLEMIRYALARGLQVKTLLADGDYCRVPLIKALRQLQLFLVSKVRRDTWWYVGTDEVQLNVWAQTLAIETCHYYPGFGYAKGIEIACHGCAPCKLVVLRPKRSSPVKDWYFLLSSDVTLSVPGVLRAKCRRWRIEVVIRDSSQQLGLKQHQGQLKTSLRHVLMSFLAYNFLSGFKAQYGRTIGYWRKAWAQHYTQERTRVSAKPLLPEPCPPYFRPSS